MERREFIKKMDTILKQLERHHNSGYTCDLIKGEFNEKSLFYQPAYQEYIDLFKPDVYSDFWITTTNDLHEETQELRATLLLMFKETCLNFELYKGF